MQLLEFLKANFRPIILCTSFCMSNYYIISYLLQRKEEIAKYQQILKKKIISIQQAQQKVKQQKFLENDTFLIKVYPQSESPKIQIRKKLRSNQLWILQPSLNKIANQVTFLMNKYFYDKSQKNFNMLQQSSIEFDPIWSIKTSNKNQKVIINGFGQIVDHQVFQIKQKYTPIQKKGIFKKLHQNIAYYFQLILFSFRTDPPNLRQHQKLSKNQKRAPFIKGPIIGSVLFLFDFIRDRPILIEAKIQDRMITPITIASSKEKLLLNIDSKVWGLNIKISGLLFCSYACYRFLSPYIRKGSRFVRNRIKQYIKQGQLIPKRHVAFRSTDERINQNCLCIICYTNCRNTLLFNCRHLIMCDECEVVYKDRTCPLCKIEIDDDKILARD